MPVFCTKIGFDFVPPPEPDSCILVMLSKNSAYNIQSYARISILFTKLLHGSGKSLNIIRKHVDMICNCRLEILLELGIYRVDETF